MTARQADGRGREGRGRGTGERGVFKEEGKKDGWSALIYSSARTKKEVVVASVVVTSLMSHPLYTLTKSSHGSTAPLLTRYHFGLCPVPKSCHPKHQPQSRYNQLGVEGVSSLPCHQTTQIFVEAIQMDLLHYRNHYRGTCKINRITHPCCLASILLAWD